jgi:hypothetical protein
VNKKMHLKKLKIETKNSKPFHRNRKHLKIESTNDDDVP